MSNTAQQRAIKNYRARLTQRGIKRFEIMAPETDRELIRALARRLSEDSREADELRIAMKEAVEGKVQKSGSIVSALRRSPMVGAELDLSRTRETGHPVEL